MSGFGVNTKLPMQAYRRKIVLPLIFSVAALAFQCKSLLSTVFTKPKVAIENVKLKDLALSGVSTEFTISVDNPNSYGVTVKNLSYQLFIESEEFINGSKADRIDIDGKKINKFTLPLTVKYSGLKTGIGGILHKKKIKYHFIGKVTLDTKVGDFDFDIDKEGNIPIPNRPKFSINKVSIKDMGITSATLNFAIAVTNNQDVRFDISRLHYKVRINDIVVSQATEEVESALTENANMSFNIPVNVKLLGMKNSLFKVIKSGKFKYNFDLNIVMKSQYGPYNLNYKKESLTTIY